ncbi:MAG: PepSY domain-containing protein [Alphaproteobacteria bacterium]|nr:PepSY domain-containing protein [Alphaproteobacteria bacterium]
MKRRTALPASLVAALALAVGPAMAATTAAMEKAEMADFQHAKITLGEAIAAAAKESAGEVTNVAFNVMHGKSGYAVTVLADGKMQSIWVDGQSGKAMPTAKLTTADVNEQSLDKIEASSLKGAKTSLSQAVAMAEQHAGGKAIEAGVGKRDKTVGYDISLLRDGKRSSVWVDPATGKITAPNESASLSKKGMKGG